MNFCGWSSNWQGLVTIRYETGVNLVRSKLIRRKLKEPMVIFRNLSLVDGALIGRGWPVVMVTYGSGGPVNTDDGIKKNIMN